MHETLLLTDLAVVWISALLAGYICARLKQPLAAGYIIAGIIIGPYGIKLIDQTNQIHDLAEFGVALLLFALGVEVSLRQMLGSAVKTIIAGLLQISLTVAATCGLLALFAPFAFGQGSTPGWSATSLFGFICALSSTAIVTKLLDTRHETESQHGQILVPILLVQDLSLVPLISLMPVFQSTNSSLMEPLLWAIAKSSLLIALVVACATRILPRVFSWIAHSNSRELFILTVISLCFGIALISKELGLSLALGAFLAGITISESPYGHQALSDLLPLRDLFATVFFVSVGLLLNPTYVAAHWVEVSVFVVALMVGKALIGTISSLAATKSLFTAILVGVSLAQIGEFSFVLALVGRDAGILPDSLYNLFLSGAVVSLIASPPLINAVPAILKKIAWRQDLFKSGWEDEKLKEGKWSEHVVLCGYGRIGRNIGQTLKNSGMQIVVLEIDGSIVAELRDQGIDYVYGDSSRRVVLKEAHLQTASCLVVAVPDPLATLATIRLARRINPGLCILARVHRKEDVDVFRAAGANAVIQPEFEASIEITRLILLHLGRSDTEIQKALAQVRARRIEEFQPNIHEPILARLLGFPHDESTGAWFQIDVQEVHGKTIGELDIRRRTGATVMAIKRDATLTPYPDPDTKLEAKDEAYVIGNPDQLAQFEKHFHARRFCPLSDSSNVEPSTA